MKNTADIRALVLSDLSVVNIGTITVSFVIAEMFYKFGSFAIEAAAFLGTWYALRLIARTLIGRS